MIENKKYHIAFWLFIGFLLSVTMYIFTLRLGTSSIASIIPLMTVIIQISVAEKIIGKNSYYPKTIIGYLTLNVFFFILFIGIFIYYENLIVVKSSLFVIMTIIGLYTTFNLIKFRKVEHISKSQNH